MGQGTGEKFGGVVCLVSSGQRDVRSISRTGDPSRIKAGKLVMEVIISL